MEVFVINLSSREDRRQHIISVFDHFPHFNVKMIKAIEDPKGSQGVFKSFSKIIQISKEKDLEYVVICEDDHTFSNSFNIEKLYKNIDLARSIDCDVLLGGPSNIQDGFFYNSSLLWVSRFSGLQFVIVFKKFYDQILSYDLPSEADFDLELGKISNRIFSVYPIISYQKDFGYSDVTIKNNYNNVEKYFIDCQEKMNKLFNVSKFYGLV